VSGAPFVRSAPWRGPTSHLALPVLLYHRIGPAVAGSYPSLTVSPGRFRLHVRWLHRRGYRTVRPRDWLAWLDEGAPLPRRPVMITFDDAYADLAHHAFPVLREHGFSAVVFTVTGRIGGTNTWDAARGAATLQLLSSDQIRRWAAGGIEFGAHTRTHSDLADPRVSLLDEVDGSADDLKRLLGSEVDAFAYPWGRTAPAAEARVRQVFPSAFTTADGLNTPATDRHRLRRTMVQPDDGIFALRLRVAFGRDPVRGLRGRIRLRSRLRRLRRPRQPATDPSGPRVVVHLLPTAGPQGAAQVGIVRGLVSGLDRDRYAPEVWFLDGGGVLAEGFREAEIPVRTFSWGGIRGNPAASLRLVRAMRGVGPAYLHVHAGGGTLPLLGRLAGAAHVIVHQHGRVRDERTASPAVFRHRGAHVVVANSHATAACVRHPRVHVVHPGSDPQQAELPRKAPSEALVIGTACRFVPLKGLPVLFDAVSRLRPEFPHLRLEIAGAGPEEDALRGAARALGIEGCVRFLGWVPDLSGVAKGWDAFVLPSLEEAFGMVLVEAMHMGLPVVATLVGGVPEIVEDRVTGSLVPAGDPVGLAAAIGHLLRSPEARRALGAAGRQRARDRFCTEAMVAQLDALYAEIETLPDGRSR
jgi:glycosyltransferase involved in cell wall biosynthesis